MEKIFSNHKKIKSKELYDEEYINKNNHICFKLWMFQFNYQ